MKPTTIAMRAILAAGQAKRVDLYDITLSGGSQTYHFCTGQVPITYGGHVYTTGLTINRGSTTQSVGLQVQTMDITISPQADSPAGAVTIGGFPFLQGCANRVLDGARIVYSKMFLSDYNDPSPGAMPWFQGRVNKVTVTRLSAVITLNSDIEMLNVQMPINVLQPGCLHTLFDAGCGLSSSAFQVSGACVAGSTVLDILTNLSQANDYFTLGRITFTTGVNAGISRAVKQHLVVGGPAQIVIPNPLPTAPASGDAFIATPGCDKTSATCQTKFNNLQRFRGYPFVPVPETLYDGGVVQTTRQTLGGQGGRKTGSTFGGGLGTPNYRA